MKNSSSIFSIIFLIMTNSLLANSFASTSNAELPGAEFNRFWQSRLATLDNTPAAGGFLDDTHYWFRDTAEQTITVRCLNKTKASRATVIYITDSKTMTPDTLFPGACTFIYDQLKNQPTISDPTLPTDAQPLFKATVDCLRLLQGLAGSDRFITGRTGIVAEAQTAPVAFALAALAPEQIKFIALHEPMDSLSLPAAQQASLSVKQLAQLAVTAPFALSGKVLAADVFAPCLFTYSTSQAVTALELAKNLPVEATTCLLSNLEYTPLSQTIEAQRLINYWVINGCLPAIGKAG